MSANVRGLLDTLPGVGLTVLCGAATSRGCQLRALEEHVVLMGGAASLADLVLVLDLPEGVGVVAALVASLHPRVHVVADVAATPAYLGLVRTAASSSSSAGAVSASTPLSGTGGGDSGGVTTSVVTTLAQQFARPPAFIRAVMEGTTAAADTAAAAADAPDADVITPSSSSSFLKEGEAAALVRRSRVRGYCLGLCAQARCATLKEVCRHVEGLGLAEARALVRVLLAESPAPAQARAPCVRGQLVGAGADAEFIPASYADSLLVSSLERYDHRGYAAL